MSWTPGQRQTHSAWTYMATMCSRTTHKIFAIIFYSFRCDPRALPVNWTMQIIAVATKNCSVHGKRYNYEYKRASGTPRWQNVYTLHIDDSLSLLFLAIACRTGYAFLWLSFVCSSIIYRLDLYFQVFWKSPHPSPTNWEWVFMLIWCPTERLYTLHTFRFTRNTYGRWSLLTRTYHRLICNGDERIQLTFLPQSLCD